MEGIGEEAEGFLFHNLCDDGGLVSQYSDLNISNYFLNVSIYEFQVILKIIGHGKTFLHSKLEVCLKTSDNEMISTPTLIE